MAGGPGIRVGEHLQPGGVDSIPGAAVLHVDVDGGDVVEGAAGIFHEGFHIGEGEDTLLLESGRGFSSGGVDAADGAGEEHVADYGSHGNGGSVGDSFDVDGLPFAGHVDSFF